MIPNGNGIEEEEYVDHVARAQAQSAVNHALSVVEAVGRLSGEVSDFRAVVSASMDNLGGKVDAAISDMRNLGHEVRSMRPKVDSISDADDRLSDLEREVQKRKKAEAKLKARTMQALMALVLAFATVVGTAIGLTTLHHVPGITVPAK